MAVLYLEVIPQHFEVVRVIIRLTVKCENRMGSYRCSIQWEHHISLALEADHDHAWARYFVYVVSELSRLVSQLNSSLDSRQGASFPFIDIPSTLPGKFSDTGFGFEH